MKLYIMRHGPAEDAAPSGIDADRALTEAGIQRVRDVVEALEAAGEMPASVLSSPLLRARQTARLVAPIASKSATVVLDDALAPAGNGAALVRGLILERREGVLLVGHEPDLSALIETLTEFDFPRAMQKAMVVGIEAEAEGKPADIRFILDPKSRVIERS